MVERLRRDGLLRMPALVDAFAAVPREWFVPGVDPSTVYDVDAAIPTAVTNGVVVSSSSAPRVMAVMLERLDLRIGHRVLEIGTGTGYNAALLAHVVGPTGSVTTVDIDETIVDDARRRLADAGMRGVRCLAGDGWRGVSRDERFDRIIVTVGVSDIAHSWTAELAPDGVLVVPLWLRRGLQVIAALRPDRDDLVAEDLEPCGFMRLRGPHAGGERYQPCGPWSVAVDDDMSDESLRRLEELLTGAFTTVEVPPVSRGWFTALALTHANAVQLTNYPRWAVGLFDPGRRALALLPGDQRGPQPEGHLYGDIDRARQLNTEMFSVEPHPLATLRLRVTAPQTAHHMHHESWALPRAEHTLLLSADPGLAPLDRPAVGWE